MKKLLCIVALASAAAGAYGTEVTKQEIQQKMQSEDPIARIKSMDLGSIINNIEAMQLQQNRNAMQQIRNMSLDS
ncbi:MAG: hypothetical protein LBG13_01550 [Holosporales bacterium]|nr:hypothetical protein [Holosporales bacterium]